MNQKLNLGYPISAQPYFELEVVEGVAVVRMDQPNSAMNTISTAMQDEFQVSSSTLFRFFLNGGTPSVTLIRDILFRQDIVILLCLSSLIMIVWFYGYENYHAKQT